MKASLKLNSLSAAILLAAGAQSALALAPTESPNIVINISGGAAQDIAIDGFIERLALDGTFDLYYDNKTPSNPGSNWRSYFFKTNNTKIPGLASGSTPVNVLINKRSYGAAGYGVVPLLTTTYQVDQLDIKAAGAATPPAGGEKFWRVDATKLQKTISLAGISGLNPELYYGINYPTAIGTDPAFPQLDVSKASNTLDIVPIGGLTYGLSVTEDLYKTLQAAQIETGTLPADTQIGNYSKEAWIPTLSRNFVASLISGKIRTWDEIHVIDERDIDTGKATTGKDLGTLTSFASKAGVQPPDAPNLVALANRNKGAAIGGAFNAYFLNAPGTQNALTPATAPGNDQKGPVVYEGPGAGQVDSALVDWQNATNLNGSNPGSKKRWGVGQQSIDRNASGQIGKNPSRPLRYVRIDGYAGTLANVASGNYPLWTEQTIQWRKEGTAAPKGDELVVLKKLADDIGNASSAAEVNAKSVSTFGPTGIFAISTSATITENVQFDTSKPVVNYTYLNAGFVNNGIVPAYNNNKPGTVTFK